jgi:hypothetical protein
VSDLQGNRKWYQGNRWYHGVIAFLLVGVLFVGANLIFEGKAFGMNCSSGTECTPTQHKENFKADKYDRRGKADAFPPRIERMIKRKYNRIHQGDRTAMSARRFFNRLDAGANCYWVGGWVQMCDPDPGISHAEKETYKVVFACGGAAVLGAVRGGGWWGAGIGGGGCFWGKMIDLW